MLALSGEEEVEATSLCSLTNVEAEACMVVTAVATNLTR
jgi:hypothetical protein